MCDCGDKSCWRKSDKCFSYEFMSVPLPRTLTDLDEEFLKKKHDCPACICGCEDEESK